MSSYKIDIANISETKEIIASNKVGYVVFDIETTGFKYQGDDRITEIGAVKYVFKNGQLVEEGVFSQLVNPERKIPFFITNLTGIDDMMVRNEPTIEEVLPKFKEFIEGGFILVAHNAKFDMNFTGFFMNKCGIEFPSIALDTLAMSRKQYPQEKSHKLDMVCKRFGIVQENHHRAVDDAKVTGQVFMKLLNDIKNNRANASNQNHEEKSELKNTDMKDVQIKSISYWEKNSLKRIYVNTVNNQKGYYDVTKEDEGINGWNLDSITGVELNSFNALILELLEIESIEELSKFKGRKYF